MAAEGAGPCASSGWWAVTKHTADIIVLLLLAGPFAVAALYVGAMALWTRREEKARRYLEHEKARIAAGLPAHERCPCESCAEWRRHIDKLCGYERGLL